MTPAAAAARAWGALIRKGLATRSVADALVEAFDLNDDDPPEVTRQRRDAWQYALDANGRTAGWGPFVDAAVARFDLVHPAPGGSPR